jgi:rare lipoprotein A
MQKLLMISLASFMIAGCVHTTEAYNNTHIATASWYSTGHRTASGEKFNPYGMTVAHKTLPFGTVLKVTNLANDKSVIVVVNDRGPFVKNREYDLSKGAAKELGFIKSGKAKVLVEVLEECC